MNQPYIPFYQPMNNNIEQLLLRIEQELKKINQNLEKENNTNNNYLQKDDNLYIL